ncbi:MAG: nucleotidyltransferase family protein [Acidimicrobiales bacterium]
MSVAAVILAAGAGTRFDATGGKLLAEAHGRPLVAWAIEPAYEADFDELVVVTGAVDLGDVIPGEATVLRNDGWQQGQATSLGVALDWCHRQGHAAAVVGVGDQPGLTADAWLSVAEAPGGPIVMATYAGKRGFPVRLDASMWSLLPSSGEEGVATLVRTRPELVVELACQGAAVDIDTREDLRKWK